MGKRDFYDPYTMRIKEIRELIPELSKLIMRKLPGGQPIETVWAVLCEAARLHEESLPGPDLEDRAEFGKSDFWMGQQAGKSYAAHVMIRKIADGMGVSNFTLREVPLEVRPDPSGSVLER